MLPRAEPAQLGLDARPLERLCAWVAAHVAAGRTPGAQVAVARHGKLALTRSFGLADPEGGRPATDATPFLLYSNTKVITAAAVWSLVDEGRLGFHAPVADHLPAFAAHGKAGITPYLLLLHQAGFPDAVVPPAAWEDHALLRETVCAFRPAWEPGARIVYHPASAHWTLAALIEAATGEDFRAAIAARVLAPLGLEGDIAVGLPPERQADAAPMHDPLPGGGFAPRLPECSAAGMAAGIPGGGGYGTAAAMATFYQALLAGGTLPGRGRICSPRGLDYALRDHTGDRVDEYMGLPMHRGLGPHLRGTGVHTRGLGTLAHPRTFGHGGVGSSYCWADPDSGVSFAFLSNARLDEDTHRTRMETVSNFVHAAIVER